MKLLYATSILFPSPLANRVQVAQMAEAFTARLGKNFLLGVGRADTATPIRSAVVEVGEKISSYALAYRYARLASAGSFTHVFTREPKLLFFLAILRPILRVHFSLVFEIHQVDLTDARWFRFSLRRADRIVSITEGIRQVLRKKGLPWEGVLVAPDAVDLTKFDIPVEKHEARAALGLPSDRKIILYSGSVESPGKGVGLLYESAKSFGDEWLFLVVGARPSHVTEFLETRPETSNFKLLGYRPHAEIPLYIKASDVAVLPNLSTDETSRICTSPMKLFEYMAARRPIVAARLPSTEEVLSASSGARAEYFTADDAADLARAIRSVGTASAGGHTLPIVAAAYEAVLRNTWDARAQNILKFIS